MLSRHDIPGTQYDIVPLPAVGATDATSILAAWAAPYKCKVVSLEFVGSAAVTGQASNYRTLSVTLADATEIATLAFSSAPVAAVKGVALPITLTGTATTLALAKGAGLMFVSTKTGNGLAFPTGCWRIGYRGV